MTLAISLAQWSLHRAICLGELDPLDFPRAARREFDIDAVEIVSQLLPGPRREVVRELGMRAQGEGVRIILVMVDDEGDLSHPRLRVRKRAVERHRTWLDAAAAWGARAVRVNTGGERWLERPVSAQPSAAAEHRDAVARCAESCALLADHGRPLGLSVLLENHGGLSANAWILSGVVKASARDNVGLLPDFGNFHAGADRTRAVEAMMPHARAVSAKTYDFDDAGNECTFDFARLMQIVVDSGYSGHIGIEYEGRRLSEPEGIRRSKALLERWVGAR